MLHIKSLEEGLNIFKALGSEIRVEIIKILLKSDGMNMNELAQHLEDHQRCPHQPYPEAGRSRPDLCRKRNRIPWEPEKMLGAPG